MRECPVCGRCMEEGTAACPVDGSPLEQGFPGSVRLDGTYDLEQRLGRGGMGTVYRARHRELDRPFAVKLVLPAFAADPAYQAFFRSEALALGRLRHPAIVSVTDAGVDARGLPYLVMELLEGRSLGARLREGGPLGIPEALPLLRAVAEGVDYAHTAGILHRDLKPDNLFVSTDGPPKVLDFGLALLALGPEVPGPPQPSSTPLPGTTVPLPGCREPDATTPLSSQDVPVLVGTPGYLAPELYRGVPASRASDVYAFGATARALLGDHLPPGITGALAAALDADPARRPPSLCALVDQLERAWDRHLHRAWVLREGPRRRLLALGAGLCAAALAGGLGMAGPVRSLDHALDDQRVGWMAPVAPDPRILLVELDEPTLDDGSANFFAQADRLAAGLEALCAGGADAVGLDLLLPRRYQESEVLSRLVLDRRDRLALALHVRPGEAPRGWECLGPLTRLGLGGPDSLAAVFGLVNLEADRDGRVRRFRSTHRAADGLVLEPLAVRLARVAPPPGEVLVDHRIDSAAYPVLPWSALEQQAPVALRGRIVLVGLAGASQEDLHAIPALRGRKGEVPGLALHALMVQTLLEGGPLRRGPAWPGLGMAAAVAGLGTWGLLRRPRLVGAWGLAAALAGASLGASLLPLPKGGAPAPGGSGARRFLRSRGSGLPAPPSVPHPGGGARCALKSAFSSRCCWRRRSPLRRPWWSPWKGP